ncbi:MAG: glutathione S-transferase [Marinibacterium sp.]|nr:glutathione S-transferase [Marinibacterium sp.]
MIFYDCSTAPNPRRARMFLAEKGITPEVREVSILKGEQLSPAFLAVNPMGTIPALVTDDGAVITENAGIAAYLEALQPEPPLLGVTPLEKGEVARWNAIAEQQGGAPIAEAFRNSHPAMQGRAIPGPRNHAQIPELAERGRQRLADFLDLLEARLEGRTYLATDSFSMADITCFVMVDFARVIQAQIPQGNTATLAWFERIRARPSAQV